MRRAAFTLLELVICVALVGVFVGALFAFYLDVARTGDRVVLAAREGADATLFFDRLEGDLACAIAGGGSRGAGVVGGPSKVGLLTRSATLSAAHPSDLWRCEYAFGAGVIRVARGAASGGNGRAEETLAEGVDLVRFRYFDGRTWAESFDSSGTGALPVAIEAAVWFASRGPARPGRDEPGLPADEGGWTPGDQGGPDDSLDAQRLREPDRLRVMIVPDGPVASWSQVR